MAAVVTGVLSTVGRLSQAAPAAATTADQRVDQFIRLREVIEERASRKFFEEQAQADRPVVLRSNDFIR